MSYFFSCFGEVDFSVTKLYGVFEIQSELANPTPLVPGLFLVGLETVRIASGPCKRTYNPLCFPKKLVWGI